MIFKADESTKGGTQELLEKALYKRAQGRGMGATEISLVRAYDRARQHGETLHVRPYNDSPPIDEPRSRKNNISIEDVEGLQKAIKSAIDTAIDDADGGGSGSSTVYPFDITVASGVATFAYGTINGIAPTNIGSSLSISMTGTQYVYLACSAVDGSFVSSTISIGSSAPGLISTNIGYPPNSFSILIHVVVSGTPFRVINRSSLQAISKEAFRTQKVITTPDMLPYDSYYTWSISDV